MYIYTDFCYLRKLRFFPLFCQPVFLQPEKICTSRHRHLPGWRKLHDLAGKSPLTAEGADVLLRSGLITIKE